MTLIELYYSDICANCHYVRQQLMDVLPEGVTFKEINITGPGGEERAKQLGIFEVPSIAIDGDVVLVGRVDRDEIEREIRTYL